MRVQDIKIAVVKRTPGADPVTPRIPRFYRQDEHYSAVVRVITDDGVEGHGRLNVWPRQDKGYSRNELYSQCSQVLGRIKPELVGRDASDREWLWNQRYVYEWWGGLNHRTTAAVDVALWDIAGKAAGVPVYKLLGAARHKVPAYCSGPYYPNPEQHAELAAVSKKLGYRAFKMKPGGEPVDQVKKTARLVREAAGDDMALMLDAALAYNYQEALEIGQHLQDLGFVWFEDPVRHNDFAAWERLCRRLTIPIAYTDHTEVRFYDVAEMLRRNSWLRIVRGDTAKDGITGLKKLCSLAEGLGVNCEVHMGGLPQLHVILSAANCDYYEDSSGGWLERGGAKADPSGPLAVDSEGYVHAPAAPGVGVSYDFSRMNIVEQLD